MKNLKLFFTAFIFFLCASAYSQKIADANAKLYATKNFTGAIFPASYIEYAIGSQDRFTPEQSDINKAEQALRLNIKTISEPAPAIAKNLPKFYRQYLGYVNQYGERMILINCFQPNDLLLKKWLDHFIIVEDNPKGFWNVEYNLEKNMFSNFYVKTGS